MIRIHEKASRGTSRTGWLDSRHTFSFGGFKDPTRMGFGNLRVLNEDHIIPGSGFAPHRHESMDILTMVLSGRLRHEDDQGNVQTIGPDEVQLMSAGDGITHAEWNASDAEPAHFLQIWMIPDRPGGAAHYAQARLPDQRDDLLLAAAPGKGGLLPLRSSSAVTILRGTEGGTRQIGSDSWPVSGDMVRQAYSLRADDDDFSQAGQLVREVMDEAQRNRLVDTVAGALRAGVRSPVLERAIDYWKKIDPEIGAKIARKTTGK